MGRPAKPVKYHVTKRRYYATFADSATGRERSHYFTATTEPAALAEYAEWLKQRERDCSALILGENGKPQRVARPSPGQAASGGPPPSRQRLSDCWTEWLADREADNRSPGYIRDIKRVYDNFIRIVGNRPLNLLTQKDVVKYQDAVSRTTTTEHKSAKWYGDAVKAPLAVMRTAKRRNMDWPWPSNLIEWLSSYKRKAYRPDKSNRQDMPSGIFRQLLTACEQWQQSDPASLPTESQADKGRRAQAYLRRRNGYQFAALLRLAVNCGLDAVDCQRIKWSDLKLTESVPHLNFSRSKCQWRTGQPEERLIPLAAETITALSEWSRQYPSHSRAVFNTAVGSELTKNVIAYTLIQLQRTAGITDCDYSFKHIRNVAPSLRKRNGLPSEMSDYILGHRPRGDRTSDYYEADVDERYLLPLVDLVRRDYLSQVATPLDRIATHSA